MRARPQRPSSRLAVRGATLILRPARCASHRPRGAPVRDAATVPVGRSDEAWLFLPSGCYKHIAPTELKVFQDSYLVERNTPQISHNAACPFSTSRLKLRRYSSTLRDRLGGSKTERIFSVISVS